MALFLLCTTVGQTRDSEWSPGVGAMQQATVGTPLRVMGHPVAVMCSTVEGKWLPCIDRVQW